MSSKDRVLLAETYNTTIDPTGHYMSEKLDGVRAIWDGSHLRTREHWHVIAAPAEFVNRFPRGEVLDGELCGPDRGYKEFQRIVGIVKSDRASSREWSSIRYMAFDAPDVTNFSHGAIGKIPFEARLSNLARLVSYVGAVHVRMVEQTLCRSRAHFEETFEKVRDADGEGIMLRRARSLYACARSMTLLKVKVTHDAEAVVTGYTQGKGSRAGVIGALVCKFPNGVEFNVGSGLDVDECKNPPKVGARVTIRYDALSTTGKPRAPRFIAVRDYE